MSTINSAIKYNEASFQPQTAVAVELKGEAGAEAVVGHAGWGH